MTDVETCLPPIILKYRTRLASIWLARSRATASNAMKVMMGATSITVHSASSAELLLRFDWSGETMIVETAEPGRLYKFADLDASLTFINAILLNSAHVLSEPHSLAPVSLMDEAFWRLNSTRKAKSAGTETKQKAKPGRTTDGPTPRAIPMDTASMAPWVGAWAR